jgi:hypothetical protein
MKEKVMKKSILWVLMTASVGLTPVCFGQLRPIPAAVTNAFAEKFPVAKNVEWRDKITEYHAIFTDDHSKCEAKFKSDGTWINTEKSIGVDSLPLQVKEGLHLSKYADWEINSVFIIYSPGDVKQYHVVVSKSELGKKILFFNTQGQLLKDNFSL